MDFILSMVGRLESEKHSIVLREILSLVNKYPHLLTANVVNKVSNLGEGASSAARGYIQELKNEFNSREITTTDIGGGGVTVVKLGTNGELLGGGNSNNNKTSHLYQQQTASKVENRGIGQSTSGSRTKLQTHRSMTKLNNVSSQFDSGARLGLHHKSMTKLENAAVGSSQQNMARFSSSSQMTTAANAGTAIAIAPTAAPSRSVTCISTSAAASKFGAASTRVMVGTGQSSPTKSMSSGSMTGMGREVLTVNVNQINEDLIRQVSSVLGDINGLLPPPHQTIGGGVPTTSFTHIHALSTMAAPFSLPSQSSRRCEQ